MYAYLNDLVAREHVSELMAQAARQRVRRELKQSRNERPSQVRTPAMPAVYCQRAAAPVGPAVA